MTADRYAEWDAAYVLGSLGRADRKEFERHLTTCSSCTVAVAELHGMPALLGTVSAAEAVSLVDQIGDDTGPVSPLAGLAHSVRLRRRRFRTAIAAAVLAASAAAVVLVIPHAQNGQRTQSVVLEQVVPSPLSAAVKLSAQNWGTRIDMNCHYAAASGSGPAGYASSAAPYAMFVTDSAGRSTQVATWLAKPGSTVKPSGATPLAPNEIKSVEIRSVPDGRVLLQSTR
jgi:RNA polymerase sigma-70 factor (ECF subfamily)